MWNIKYPYVNDEILNLDWILAKIKEMDLTLKTLMDGAFDDLVEKYFNEIMIDAIYHEDEQQIELKKELMVGDGLHIYNVDDEEMIIDGE